MGGRIGIRDEGRILVAELDSMEQSRMFGAAPTLACAQRKVLGILRTAALLADRVVLTDSMLLDGVAFLTVGPKETAAGLGVGVHDLPFTILSRSQTLRAALEAKRSTPGFVWQTAGSDALQEGSEEWPYQQVVRAWEEWVRAAENGDLAFECTDAPRSGRSVTFAEQLEARLADGAPTGLTSPALALTAEARGVANRSAFVSRFDTVVAEHPAARAELESVRAWWNEAYLDVLAAGNRASWLRLTDLADAQPRAAAAGGSRRQLGLSGTMLDTMTSIPPSVYGILRHSLRSERADFVATGSRRSLAAIAYGVSSHLAFAGRGHVVRGALVRLAIAAVAVFIGVVPLDGPWLGLDLAWVAVTAVALVTIPWQEFPRLYGLSRRALGGVVSVKVRS